jgi:AraC-like DNA-binding protein
VALSTSEYFRLWDALEKAFNDPSFPLRLGQAVSVESFSPPIFAALCSPNLNVAVRRLSQFKRLIGPMTLDVMEDTESTMVSLGCLYADSPLPASLVATELVFLVHLVRLATREPVNPLSVTSSVALASADSYSEYFGVSVTKGDRNSITFSALDARRPFLTINEQMWNFFEPDLRRRLSDMDTDASFAARVHSSLLELLPSGQNSIDDVARTLAVSRRTLQRRLNEESTSFQVELNRTREQLARHYLANSALSGAQISFLLGFEDPNSFFRAFHSWTGTTPRQLRTSEYVQSSPN